MTPTLIPLSPFQQQRIGSLTQQMVALQELRDTEVRLIVSSTVDPNTVNMDFQGNGIVCTPVAAPAGPALVPDAPAEPVAG